MKNISSYIEQGMVTLSIIVAAICLCILLYEPVTMLFDFLKNTIKGR